MRGARLRNSEWLLLAFFAYIAGLIPFFRDRPRLGAQPVFILVAVFSILAAVALAEVSRYRAVIAIVRDWLPIPLTLVAFREMELFVPLHYNAHYEHAWIQWDKILLND